MTEKNYHKKKTPPGYSCQVRPPDVLVIHFSGNWTLDFQLPDLNAGMVDNPDAFTMIRFNHDQLQRWDSLLPVFILEIIRWAKDHDIKVDLESLPSGVLQLLHLARSSEETTVEKKAESKSLLERVGLKIIKSYHHGGTLATFTGEIIFELFQLFRGKSNFRPRDFFYFVQAAGADALPIVSLISFLVGVILAFVGAVQLQMFGAQIYVANLVGLAMVLEMGAMMSGIIMAGRTGAAYAAQLGTMQVNEEIDALRTLGISPIGFLVLPRILALMLMLPLLCIYADFIGILGGATIGVLMLDLSLTEYFLYTKNAIHLDQIMQGLTKSCVYGILVGYAGCLRGVHCGRSASSVGEATTSAVVTSMVLIIISDAIMTFLFTFMKTG